MSKQSIRAEINKVERNIDRAVESSMSGHNGVLDKAIEAGKKRIRRKDRVWHQEVLNGFQTEVGEYAGFYKIVNPVRHAGFVNEGGDYDAPPPPENLLPWVQDHMFVFDNYSDPMDAAQALSLSLYENGLEGIWFTQVMLRYLREQGEYDLERMVNRKLEGRL